MSEGGDPKRKRNPIKNGQSSDTGTGNHEHSNLKMKTNKIKKKIKIIINTKPTKKSWMNPVPREG
jgi:hypothetical protein